MSFGYPMWVSRNITEGFLCIISWLRELVDRETGYAEYIFSDRSGL